MTTFVVILLASMTVAKTTSLMLLSCQSQRNKCSNDITHVTKLCAQWFYPNSCRDIA